MAALLPFIKWPPLNQIYERFYICLVLQFFLTGTCKDGHHGWKKTGPPAESQTLSTECPNKIVQLALFHDKWEYWSAERELSTNNNNYRINKSKEFTDKTVNERYVERSETDAMLCAHFHFFYHTLHGQKYAAAQILHPYVIVKPLIPKTWATAGSKLLASF